MAVKTMCAVLDKAAQCFMTPFFVVAEGVAIRDFLAEAANPESILCKHSKDFSLYKFGTFDDNDGVFNLFREPQFIISANSLGQNQSSLPLGEETEK